MITVGAKKPAKPVRTVRPHYPRGSLALSPWPLQRAAGQLEATDGLRTNTATVGEFVREHLTSAARSTVTVKEAYSAYLTYCGNRRLPSVNRARFDRLLEVVIAHHLHLRLRRDVRDHKGRPPQGWKGAKLL